jgi:hypothetical protein
LWPGVFLSLLGLGLAAAIGRARVAERASTRVAERA